MDIERAKTEIERAQVILQSRYNYAHPVFTHLKEAVDHLKGKEPEEPEAENEELVQARIRIAELEGGTEERDRQIAEAAETHKKELEARDKEITSLNDTLARQPSDFEGLTKEELSTIAQGRSIEFRGGDSKSVLIEKIKAPRTPQV